MTEELKTEIDLPEDVAKSGMYEVERRINGKIDRINMFLWSKKDVEKELEIDLNDYEVVAAEIVEYENTKNKITFRSILEYLGISFY